MLKIVRVEKRKEFPSSVDYNVVLVHDRTPGIEYIITSNVEKGIEEQEPEKYAIDEVKKYYFRQLVEMLDDLSLFEIDSGVILPVFVDDTGRNIADKPEHYLWSTPLLYAVIREVAGTSYGWSGLVLKSRINEKEIRRLLLGKVAQLWCKYVRRVDLSYHGEILFPKPIEFKVLYDERIVTVEACDIDECVKKEVKLKIPEGLFRDLDEIARELMRNKEDVKKIILESIREIEETEKIIGEDEFLREILEKKKNLRKQVLTQF